MDTNTLNNLNKFKRISNSDSSDSDSDSDSDNERKNNIVSRVLNTNNGGMNAMMPGVSGIVNNGMGGGMNAMMPGVGGGIVNPFNMAGGMIPGVNNFAIGKPIIDLSTRSAHVYIPAITGAGKTTLAKIILNINKPFRYWVFSPNKTDWKKTYTDISDLQRFFEAVKREKERDPSPHIQAKKYIVVFDDFNNQPGVNMWTNKTIKTVFTEGRKYNFHGILMSHTTRDTGKEIRNMCHFTIVFKPRSLEEMRNLSSDFVLGDNALLTNKLKELKSKYDYLVIAAGEIKACQSDLSTMTVSEINPSGGAVMPSGINGNDSSSGSSGGSNSSGGQSTAMDTSIKTMGNNNVIKQQNNIVQSAVLKNSQMFVEQKLAHELKMKEIMYENELAKQALRVRATDIISKHRISISEKNELIEILNKVRKKYVVIGDDNLALAVKNFSRKYMGYPHEIIIDHYAEPVQAVIRGDSFKEVGLNLFNGYRNLFLR